MSLADLNKKEELVSSLAVYVKEELGYRGEEVSGHLLYRFLRARGYDVQKAQEMLRDYAKFQQGLAKSPEKFMELSWEKFDAIRSRLMEGLFETDREGRPVHYVFLGRMNLKEIVDSFSIEEMLNYMIIRFERLSRVVLPAMSVHLGRPVDRITSVIDMSDVSPFFFISGKPAEFLRQYFHVLQTMYPELLEKAFVVNVSMLFKVLLTFAQPFLHKNTLARMEVVKGDALKRLSEVIPPENIPAVLGGKSQANVKDSPGPWQPLLTESIKRKTWLLKDLEVLSRKENPGEPPLKASVLGPLQQEELRDDLKSDPFVEPPGPTDEEIRKKLGEEFFDKPEEGPAELGPASGGEGAAPPG